MSVIEFFQFIRETGLPGALAIGTVFLLFLYLRNERIASSEPNWITDLRMDLRRIEDGMNEGFRVRNAQSDKVDDKLHELVSAIAEIKATVSIIERRND